MKKKISTRLTKENPMQSPSIPPMLAMKVVADITLKQAPVQIGSNNTIKAGGSTVRAQNVGVDGVDGVGDTP